MKKVLAAALPAALLVGLVSTPAQASGHSGTLAQPVGSSSRVTAISVKGTPARVTLKIKGIHQKRWWWCSPAVGAMALRSMGITVSQDTLARKMRSSKAQGGTKDTNAVAVLSSYARAKGYRFTRQYDVDKPSKLAERVVYDVGRLRRAVPIQVFMARLPWYKGLVAKDAGHVVLAFGYDKKARTIRIWDPYNYYGTGGVHDVPLNTLAKATQSNRGYAGIYFVSKR